MAGQLAGTANLYSKRRQSKNKRNKFIGWNNIME
jgi:hypothetical protein